MYCSDGYGDPPKAVVKPPFAFNKYNKKRRYGDDASEPAIGLEEELNQLITKLQASMETNAKARLKDRQAYDVCVVVDIRERNPQQMEFLRKLSPPPCILCKDENPNNPADTRLTCQHWYHRSCLDARTKKKCKECKERFDEKDMTPALVQFKVMTVSDFAITLNSKAVNAIERKTFADLIASILSGHLAEQTSNSVLFPEFKGNNHRYCLLLELDGDQTLSNWPGNRHADRSKAIGALVNRDLQGFSTKIMPSALDTIYWIFKTLLRLHTHGKELWPTYANQPDFDAASLGDRTEQLSGDDKLKFLASREVNKVKKNDLPSDIPLSSSNFINQLVAIPRMTPEYCFLLVRIYKTPHELSTYLESQRENPQEMLEQWSVMKPPGLNAKAMGLCRVVNVYNHHFQPESPLVAKKGYKGKISFSFAKSDQPQEDGEEDEGDEEKKQE